jgi:hypothetical protein
MGFVLSKSQLAPISLASIVVGFVSFAFTVGTFLRVLWINFETLGEAPHQVHSYLTNLRTELLEERANLRVMKKNCKKHHKLLDRGGRGGRVDSGVELDEVSLKTMSDTIKQLIKRFKDVERPFLEKGEGGIDDDINPRKRRRRSQSVSPYEHSAYNSPPEKAHVRSRYNGGHKGNRDSRYADERGVDDDEDAFWAQRTKYCNYTLWKRFAWLHKKSEAQNLFDMLSRVQTRRIARQVGGLSVLVHEYGSGNGEIEEMVRRIDERMSHFVGVRRRSG